LGVKDIRKFNYALLAKWKWRLGVGEKGVWRNIIESRYGNWREMRKFMVDKKSSYWWKDLCLICEVDKVSNWFDRRIKWKHGNGGKIKLWEDCWVGDRPLKYTFPRLYSISDSKKRVVSELEECECNGNGEEFRWTLSWRREMFVWELGLKGQKLSLISIVQWQRSVLDAWCWTGEDLDSYTVQSGYKAMLDRELYHLCEGCPDVWDIKVSGSAKLLGWKTFLDRLPARVNLERRGVNIESNLCPLCAKEEETLQHLFIRCEVSQSV